MTRRKRAMAGMAKDAVPGGRDGLLARLEHAKVQMDHLARATKAEEARRARKAGGNVEVCLDKAVGLPDCPAHLRGKPWRVDHSGCSVNVLESPCLVRPVWLEMALRLRHRRGAVPWQS